MGAEKQVAMKAGQKNFKKCFRQNLPRYILGKVTFHELAITNVKVIEKTIILPPSSPLL